jgi:uncharacterized membrane protein
VISYILQYLGNRLSGISAVYTETMNQVMSGNYYYVPAMPKIGATALIIIAAIAVMSTLISSGFKLYCLKTCEGEKTGVATIFDVFARFFKVLWLTILSIVFIYLWSLLFIIPGIIAAYRYRMAIYILFDKPELSALECIRLSKQMMNGHKAELFVLDLSFLGWTLLTVIPLFSLWVVPYTEITEAYFYLALRDMPVYGYEPIQDA